MVANPELAKMLVFLARLSDPLSDDIRFAMDQLKIANDHFRRRPDNLREVCFWGKAVVSCLFAHMDALGYASRKCVVLFRTLGGLALTNRELAKLAELRYDASIDQLTNHHQRLNPPESLKLGVRYFSRLLGIEFALAVGDERWRGVLDVWKARCRFTHPKGIEDLSAVEMFGGLQSSLVWHYGELSRWFAACAGSVGLSIPASAKDLSPPGIRPMAINVAPMFTDQELEEQIERFGSRSLAYATTFFKLLRFDSDRAAQLGKRTPRRRGKRSQATPFARRLLLRTECTQVEAINAAARFQLKAARLRKEITFSDEELAPAAGCPEIVGELISAASLWSRKLGRGDVFDLAPKTMKDVAKAWKRRDRLVHPQKPEDLEIDELESLEFSLALLELQSKAYECLAIDEDAWAALGSTKGENDDGRPDSA